MIAIPDTKKTIGDLVAELRGEADLERRTELRAQLFVLLIALRYTPALRKETRRTSGEIRRILFGDDVSREVRETLEQLLDTQLTVFDQQLHAVAEDAWKEIEKGFDEYATPEILRAAHGTPVDTEGNFVPEPGDVGQVRDGASLEEILLFAAALLFIQRTRSFEVAFEEPDFRAAVEGSRPESRQWRLKLRELFSRLGIPALATAWGIRREDGESVSSVYQDVVATLGVGDRRGLSQRIDTEFSHEAFRVASEMQRAFDDQNGAYVGWIMRSRFLPTTAPDHAARDGWRFYRDDRPGSTRPWAEESLWYPPYRKNCVCFAVPIYESELQDGSETLGIDEYPDVSPRSLPDWAAWFDAQRPAVQRKLVGDRRWFATASFGQGGVRWTQMTRDGRVMNTARLLSESPQTRGERIESENVLLEERRTRYREAWRTGKFRLTPAEEADYRRRLDRLLKQVQN
jgi:hypothetical protein